jgi:hypothetical protein
MNQKRAFALLIFLLFTSMYTRAQVADTSSLFLELKALDSLLFDRGFNHCDIETLQKITSENLEFYHDQGGIDTSKATFIDKIKNGICKLDYKASRQLVDGSLQVFPMYQNGVLYGAIQMGQHEFFALYPGEEIKKTSTALFTHLWLLEDGKWMLARVLSYNHQGVE